MHSEELMKPEMNGTCQEIRSEDHRTKEICIYLDMDGILIVGTGQVTDLQGNVSEPAYGLVRSGDYILQVDEKEVDTKEELVAAICQLKEGGIVS